MGQNKPETNPNPNKGEGIALDWTNPKENKRKYSEVCNGMKSRRPEVRSS
jgi:hypothetical protein